MALLPGETRERNMSALEYSSVADFSADGQTLLLEELSGEAGRGAVYLKRRDNSPAVRLGDGEPTSLSPDGRWALATPANGELDHLLLLPTGPGERRELRHPALSTLFDAHWFPDGKRIVVTAGKEAKRARLYVWELGDKPPIPLSAEEGWGAVAVSPDGRWVAARAMATGLVLLPVGGGEPRPMPGLEDGDAPRRWSADGRWLFVQRSATLPARVDRIDVQTGERRAWKEIMPSDPTGVIDIERVIPTPDGRGYAYSSHSLLHSLYLAEGLR
jgi:hypothetical protein